MARQCEHPFPVFLADEAVELERNRPELRLIDGEQFVELPMEHYGRLSPRYRSLIPLKQIYVPDLQG